MFALLHEQVVKSHPLLMFFWAHPTNMKRVLPPPVRPSSYNAMFCLSTLGFVKHYWLWLNNSTQKRTWLPRVEEAWYLCSIYCVLWTWVKPQWMHWSALVSGITLFFPWLVQVNFIEQKCGESARKGLYLLYATLLADQGHFLWGSVCHLFDYADIFL